MTVPTYGDTITGPNNNVIKSNHIQDNVELQPKHLLQCTCRHIEVNDIMNKHLTDMGDNKHFV